MRDCAAGKINYLEKPVLVEGAITGLTGDAGCGKSSLVSAIARRVHAADRPVLILDRENPKVVVEDRFKRLRMSDNETFIVWGGWTGEEAPQPGSPIVLEWVQQCAMPPLIIIDSKSAFQEGDENAAGDTRSFLNQARQLTYLGATIVVLHHDGKAETAKDYRGSSDFKAALDIAFHVSNHGDDGRLDKLVLRCYKSRFGFGGELVYDYADGNLMQRQEAGAVSQTVAEQLTVLLRLNPGVNGSQFKKLATERSIPAKRAEQFLHGGILAKTVAYESGKRRERFYCLAGSHRQEEL